MTRKAIITSVITILFALFFFMVYSIIESHLQKKEIQAKIKSIPVKATLFNLDSTLFVFPKGRPVVLVLFNSTCEHCQYELDQFRKNIGAFNSIRLVFVSSEPINAIKGIAGLFTSASNVNFVKIPQDNLSDNFGTVRFPTILIYNSSGTLVKEFKGEVKIEAILQHVAQ